MYVDKEHLMLDEICLEPRLVGILEKVLFLAKDYDFKFKNCGRSVWSSSV